MEGGGGGVFADSSSGSGVLLRCVEQVVRAGPCVVERTLGDGGSVGRGCCNEGPALLVAHSTVAWSPIVGAVRDRQAGLLASLSTVCAGWASHMTHNVMWFDAGHETTHIQRMELARTLRPFRAQAYTVPGVPGT